VKTLRTALALLFIAAAAPQDALLREAAWTAPGGDLAAALTAGPGECLARTDALVETGRALFRSPYLLGGPAARVGLSCDACHSEGRRNAHFLLAELSDAAGTADVTAEWASKTRGDGVRNPVIIPDLVGVAGKTTFGGRREPSLETFVRGVIVEEFQGQEPSPRAFAGVLAYVRALEPGACAAPAPLTVAAAADDVRRAVVAAQASASLGDDRTTRALALAVQDRIARIAERLPAPLFDADRRRLQILSRDVASARDASSFGPAWLVRFDAAVARIARRERRTHFDATTLRKALETP